MILTEKDSHATWLFSSRKNTSGVGIIAVVRDIGFWFLNGRAREELSLGGDSVVKHKFVTHAGRLAPPMCGSFTKGEIRSRHVYLFSSNV